MSYYCTRRCFLMALARNPNCKSCNVKWQLLCSWNYSKIAFILIYLKIKDIGTKLFVSQMQHRCKVLIYLTILVCKLVEQMWSSVTKAALWMIFSRALCLCCIVPRCDFVFGSNLLFVLTQTPDCSDFLTLCLRREWESQCVRVCHFPACPCMHLLPGCVLKKGVGGHAVTAVTQPRSRGWRGWWRGRVCERWSEEIWVRRWDRGRRGRWAVWVFVRERVRRRLVCAGGGGSRERQRKEEREGAGGGERREMKADTDFSLCSVMRTITHSCLSPEFNAPLCFCLSAASPSVLGIRCCKQCNTIQGWLCFTTCISLCMKCNTVHIAWVLELHLSGLRFLSKLIWQTGN